MICPHHPSSSGLVPRRHLGQSIRQTRDHLFELVRVLLVLACRHLGVYAGCFLSSTCFFFPFRSRLTPELALHLAFIVLSSSSRLDASSFRPAFPSLLLLVIFRPR